MTIHQIIIYKKDTGEIMRGVICQECDLSSQYDPDVYSHIDGVLTTKETYVDGTGALVPYREQSSQLDQDTFTLTSLPVPCSIKINCTTYECSDEEATIVLDQPGTYEITVSAFLYFDKEFSIEYQPS